MEFSHFRQRWTKHTYLVQLLLWALLVLPACMALAYLPATADDPYSVMGGTLHSGDVAQYAAIYGGADLDEMIKPYRYRFVVPVLARYVPLPPQVLLDYFDMTDAKVMAYRFAVVNAAGLFAATIGLALLMGKLRFSIGEQLLASFLFLTSFVTVVYGTVPLVDGAAFGVLALGMAAGAWRKWILLATIILVGMFVKETSVLIAVGAILLQGTWADRRHAFLASALGLVTYAAVRLLVLPTEIGFNYSLSAAADTLAHQFTSASLVAFVGYNLLTAFGTLLVLAPLGWVLTRRAGNRPELIRLTWLLAVVMALPFLLQTSFDRVWFLAFPVVIPLSVAAVSHVLARLQGQLGEAT